MTAVTATDLTRSVVMYELMHEEFARGRIRERARAADQLRWRSELIAARRARRRVRLTTFRSRLLR